MWRRSSLPPSSSARYIYVCLGGNSIDDAAHFSKLFGGSFENTKNKIKNDMAGAVGGNSVDDDLLFYKSVGF
jgi:hypothetical protein